MSAKKRMSGERVWPGADESKEISYTAEEADDAVREALEEEHKRHSFNFEKLEYLQCQYSGQA